MAEAREHRFELVQDDMVVAAVSSENLDQALSGIWHYAMMYAQDGPVTIRSPSGDDVRWPPAALRNGEG